MKKVININFQGRVIPIEESAYEILKNYTDSLRMYFAKEEGRDEIINDIENRIAELFTEELKKGLTGCITEQNVNAVINSIGRPEDFDTETGGSESSSAGTAGSAPYGAYTAEPRGSLFRNQNDKVLGGVCSGLAHYLKLDPTIVRVLFALITFGGFGTGILIYIVLWIVLPEKGMEANIRRRLYRNPDSKVIGGVASGISAYFNVPVWVPRVVFAFPLILSILNSIFRNVWFWGDHDGFPGIFFSGFGGTLTLIYVILWMVIPEAKTASEKLEMRGEKVDLESIKNSVQEELQGLKGRAEKFGAEINERAKEWSNEVSGVGKEATERSKAFASEVAPAAKRAGNGFGHAIGVLFKAFFLFIAGIVVFSLFVAFTALLFSGVGFGLWGMKGFLISGFWDNFLFFNTVVLLFGIPIIAAVVWIIRRMTGARSGSGYLGWIFGSLWTIGIISATFLGGSISRQFKRVESVQQEVTLSNPAVNKLEVDVMPPEGKFYSIAWFDDDDRDDFPRLNGNEDSLLLNSIRVKVERSKDSNYHAYLVKFARANSPQQAEANAEKISLPVIQKDSLLLISNGFPINKETKFRNQQVMVVVEVPVGKQIKIDNSVDRFDWFTINSNYQRRNRGMLNIEWDTDWDNDYRYRTDVWYTMTSTGLERADKSRDDWGTEDDDTDRNKDGYRYERDRTIDIDSAEIRLKAKDTTININLNTGTGGRKEFESDDQVSDARKVDASRMLSVLDLMRI